VDQTLRDTGVNHNNCVSMNEARVVIVHNSKSKRENLNVYIYCCIKKHVITEKMSSKRKNQEEDHQIIATFKKCTICININMCMISCD